MRLILTRPEEDAVPLKAKLEAMGHACEILPLLRIVASPDVKVTKRNYQAICVTSANALRAFAPPEWMKQLPLLTVGPQSLEAAEAAGFAQASAQGGNVHLLAQHIERHLSPRNGPILYLAGDQVSADLHGLLTKQGFDVDKFVVYTAEPTMPGNLAHLLQGADGVLLYSPRTARLFASSIGEAGLDAAMKRITCYCLSPNVAMPLPLQWRCQVAKEANERGMLAMLDQGGQSR